MSQQQTPLEKTIEYLQWSIPSLEQEKASDGCYDDNHSYEISQAEYQTKIDAYSEILSRLLGEV